MDKQRLDGSSLGTIEDSFLKKLIVVTLGDPFSINIESLIGSLSISKDIPLVFVGSYWQWRHQLSALASVSVEAPGLSLIDGGADFLLTETKRVTSWKDIRSTGLFFLDIGEGLMPAPQLSMEERGYVATASLFSLQPLMVGVKKLGVQLAVVTCPINKKSCSLAGFNYPGQTEFFGDLWESKPIMVLAGPVLRVGLVTNHLAIADVSTAISKELIILKAELFAKTLSEAYNIQSPRIGICGLNPHCGDMGLFGSEDNEVIEPAIRELQEKSIDARGPFPADTIFFKAMQGEFDGVLAMYHDQGLAPLKTVHFYDAVNISGGMPYFRVSPDHGPAADLFLKGEARYDSLREAFAHTYRFLNGAPRESVC